MDDATRRNYVRARLDKAQDDLASAHDNLANGHLRTAINRAYYTIFHIASAGLLWHDIERARHSGTHSTFGEFFIKSGRIEADYGEIYSRARKAREKQDYDLDAVWPTQEEAAQIVADAAHFVERLERYLREAGAL